MKTTVNSDLSSLTISSDGLRQCGLSSINPLTQTPFASKAEVLLFIDTLTDNYFIDIPTPIEIGKMAAHDILIKRLTAKVTRRAKVDAILVTTTAGNQFNGDEKSQDRMTRAIIALNSQPQTPAPTITWTLANNLPVAVTAAELTEALALAGVAQSAVWVI